MADEPERRIVGAIHAELERQATGGDAEETLWIDQLASDGTLQVEGPVDLYLLARAILKEVS